MPKSHKGHGFILCIIDEVANYLITAPTYQSRSEGIGEALFRKCDIKILCSRLYNYGLGQCIYFDTYELHI